MNLEKHAHLGQWLLMKLAKQLALNYVFYATYVEFVFWCISTAAVIESNKSAKYTTPRCCTYN